MSNFEGDYMMRAVKPEFGLTSGKPKIRVEMEVVEGPLAGRRASYDGKLDEKNIRWTKQAMVALGWQGKDVRTFVDDVTKAARTLPCSVRIATHTYPDSGKTTSWSAVDKIGRTSKPLETLDADRIADVNAWFAEVPEDAHPNAPGSDESIPF